MTTAATTYGISSKFEFGKWNYAVHAFCNKTDAEEWLNAEECDFRDRELMTKSKAVTIAGRKAVENAIEHYGDEVYYPNYF